MEGVVIDSSEFATVGSRWLGSPDWSIHGNIYNSDGGIIGYHFGYEGYKYTRIDNNWDEDGDTDEYSYIKEQL